MDPDQSPEPQLSIVWALDGSGVWPWWPAVRCSESKVTMLLEAGTLAKPAANGACVVAYFGEESSSIYGYAAKVKDFASTPELRSQKMSSKSLAKKFAAAIAEADSAIVEESARASPEPAQRTAPRTTSETDARVRASPPPQPPRLNAPLSGGRDTMPPSADSGDEDEKAAGPSSRPSSATAISAVQRRAPRPGSSVPVSTVTSVVRPAGGAVQAVATANPSRPPVAVTAVAAGPGRPPVAVVVTAAAAGPGRPVAATVTAAATGPGRPPVAVTAAATGPVDATRVVRVTARPRPPPVDAPSPNPQPPPPSAPTPKTEPPTSPTAAAPPETAGKRRPPAGDPGRGPKRKRARPEPAAAAADDEAAPSAGPPPAPPPPPPTSGGAPTDEPPSLAPSDNSSPPPPHDHHEEPPSPACAPCLPPRGLPAPAPTPRSARRAPLAWPYVVLDGAARARPYLPREERHWAGTGAAPAMEALLAQLKREPSSVDGEALQAIAATAGFELAPQPPQPPQAAGEAAGEIEAQHAAVALDVAAFFDEAERGAVAALRERRAALLRSNDELRASRLRAATAARELAGLRGYAGPVPVPAPQSRPAAFAPPLPFPALMRTYGAVLLGPPGLRPVPPDPPRPPAA